MQKHIMFSLAATVLWGFWAILVKISSTRIGHWPSILVYTLFSAVTVILIFVSLGHNLRFSDTTGMLIAGAAGILGGLALIFFQKALSCGPVSTSTAISALYPVLAVIFGIFVLKEHPSTINLIGILLALTGGILISV
jgi:uncharacterized membrane protein